MSTLPSPLPRPERAVIGFFLYVSSIFAFVLYLLWAYLPNQWFENSGITYYPHKYWSITMAILVVTLLMSVVLGNYIINNLSVPSLDSMKLVDDRHTRRPVHVAKSIPCTIPPVSDLDLTFVNRVLYSADTNKS